MLQEEEVLVAAEVEVAEEEEIEMVEDMKEIEIIEIIEIDLEESGQMILSESLITMQINKSLNSRKSK